MPEELMIKGEKTGLEEHLTEEQRKKIEERLRNILSYEPRIGVFGKTGVGKSSLCNALFGQNICPVSDVEACTRNPQEVILNVGTKGVKLIDVPGLGESRARDEEYTELYANLLPELDLVLWVMQADDRATAPDANFFENLMKHHIDQGKPFFFVVNQVDRTNPISEWNWKEHEPSPNQFQTIYRKLNSVASQFGLPVSKVIAVSALEKYNLVQLVDEIIFALPKEKTITAFKAMSDDVKSQAAEEHVEKSLLAIVGDAIKEFAGEIAFKAEMFMFDVTYGIQDVIKNVSTWLSIHLPF